MIDTNIFRQNPDKVREMLKSGRANPEKVNVERWLELDEKRSDLIQERDEKREMRNELNKNLSGKPDQSIIDKSKKIKEELDKIESELKIVEAQWQEVLDWVPNIPFDEVPQGLSSEENVEMKAWIPEKGYLNQDQLGNGEFSGQFMSTQGAHKDKDFEPKPHWEIGTELGFIDTESAAKVSGSRFYYIKNEGVLIIYGIFNLLMRKLISEGFSPMIVPVLVKERALYGSSHFPGDADQVYKLETEYLEDENSLYLIGSSEPSNFAYFMDKTLDLVNKSVKVMAQTPCFRSEVGSWGKDVRGIKRTHQFDKLEMNLVMEADDNKAREAQEYLLSLNEWLLQELEIPYHVINMCIGDLGYYAAAKKYDIEFWTPSQKAYTEVMSNSITTDYQARRLNIKYKDKEGKLKHAYTLNDTGITHRILIAVLEHYQQSDGSLVIPKAIREYVGKDRVERKS
jgi:seryl-tRNA synthetase